MLSEGMRAFEVLHELPDYRESYPLLLFFLSLTRHGGFYMYPSKTYCALGYQLSLENPPLFLVKPPPPPLNLQTVQAPILGNPPYILVFH